MSKTNTEISAAAQHVNSPLVSLQETMNPKTGKLERIHANLACIYPNANDEFCFAEAMARYRGWTNKDWSQERQITSPETVHARSATNRLSTDVLDVVEQDFTPSITKEITNDSNDKPRRKKITEVKGETQTGQ